MSDPNQNIEPDPNQPNQIDQPYIQVDFFTRWIANAIASGARDPLKPIPSGDLSTLPPELREFVLKSLQEEKQSNDGASPDTAPPESPQ
jgi:hypothetical protein